MNPFKLGEWVGLSLTNPFLSYFYASYYDDVGLPCKLLPPCQGDCANLLAVFLIFGNLRALNVAFTFRFTSEWSHVKYEVVSDVELLRPVREQSKPAEGQEVDNTYEWYIQFNRPVRIT